MHPYAMVRGVFLEDAAYTGAIGGGLHLLYPINEQWRVDLDGRALHHSYNDTDDRPFADQQDGLQLDGRFILRFKPMDGLRFSLINSARVKDAEAGWNDYYELGTEARVDIFYQAPGELTEGPWHTRFYAGYSYRDYEDPDPFVTLADTRDDETISIGASHSVWFTSYDAVKAEISANFVDSTIRNFDHNNVSGVLSYTRRF